MDWVFWVRNTPLLTEEGWLRHKEKAGEAVTKLTHFEVRYRTRGDSEVMVFKQLSDNAVASAIEGGFFERSRLLLTLDELTRLRWMIVQAKEKLDEAK